MKKLGILIFVAALVTGMVVTNMFPFGKVSAGLLDINIKFGSVSGSGNIATDHGPFGGVYSGIPLSIYNSTIAFNTGTGVSGLVSAYPIVLQSTIIADNVPRDFRLYTGGSVSGSVSTSLGRSMVMFRSMSR